jgi:RNA polymerase sigma-70 factor, ECF subfamily
MPTTNTSLIRRLCTAGDKDSWIDFVGTYKSMVRSYVAGRSHGHGLRLDDHDLDEIVQTIWIKLWKHSSKFELDRERGRFRTFLYAVTMNALIDFVRRSRKHFVGRVPWERVDLETLQVSPDTDWDLAYRSAIWHRIAGALKVEIMRNNPLKWSSFELHKLHDRPAKEVAAELGISSALVYQNASRVMTEARALCLAVSEEELVDER